MEDIFLSIIVSVHPAVFLDRDGVIIENVPAYVRSWNDVIIFPQALEALACLRDSPYKVIIVTNQSAIGRGLITMQEAEAINHKLNQVVNKAGGRIDAFYICPHTPEMHCVCRKPEPGLILQAAREKHLDLSRSILIGDALSDLAAGQAAGILKNILVLTGRGLKQINLPERLNYKPFLVYASLKEALVSELAC